MILTNSIQKQARNRRSILVVGLLGGLSLKNKGAACVSDNDRMKNNSEFTLMAVINKLVRKGMFGMLMLLISGLTLAAVPEAGTFIENRATVQFVDDATNQLVNIETNEVRAEVLPKEGVDIDAPVQISSVPGVEFCIPHQVANTGNASTQVSFAIQQVTGDVFDPVSLRVVIENDPSNGVADSGEVSYSVVSGASTPFVDFDFEDVLNVLVCAQVPQGQVSGDDAELMLVATTAGLAADPATDEETDRVDVIAGADLQISIQASTTSAEPGDVVGFTIDSQNVGNAPALPVTYTVDGQPDDLVLINFPIPANTTFDGLGDIPSSVVPLYHRVGDPPGVYTTTPPPAGEIDMVAFGVPDGYPAGQSLETPVFVRVNDDAQGEINAAADIISADPVTNESVSETSNVATIDLPDGFATINNYTDDGYNQIQNTLTAPEPLYLQVNAPQCNTSAVEIDPVAGNTYTVTVTSVNAGDVEQFNMIESGLNTGLFRTSPDQAVAVSTEAAVQGNNVLEVTEEDVIEVSFNSGGVCEVDGQLRIVLVSGVSLTLQKTVIPARAQIGDTVQYTLLVTSRADSTLNDLAVNDLGAFGFQYVPGSASLSIAGNPEQPITPVSSGSALQFPIGSLQPGAEATITYSSQLGPGSVRSDGVNRAVAQGLLDPDGTGSASEIVVASVQARAEVLVDAGVFTDRGYIIGKVYADCDFDRQQGHEEIGIPGIRIYLNDGTYVVTDAEGKYSFYGLESKTWVMKLDNTTLPPGFQPKALDNRHAGVGDSRFVDLKNGELHRADFADGGCFPEMIANVKARRAKGEIFAPEIEKNLDADLLNERGFGTEVKARPASGLVDAQQGVRVEEFDLSQFLNEDNSPLPAEALSAAPQVDLKTLLKAEGGADFGFIGVQDGDVLPRQKMSVMLKGRMQAQFKLYVNGVEVPSDRVGQVVSNADTGVQAWEFVSVAFAPGRNQLKAQQVDQFGNVRNTVTANVMVADSLADMLLSIPAKPIADGSSVYVDVVLTDANGTRVNARTPVTLEVDKGRWLSPDLNPDEPGVQVFVVGGKTRFELAAPSSPQEINIRATSGTTVADAEINFLPDLRPMLAIGLVEGAISFSDNDGDTPTGIDRFERELNNFTDDKPEDDVQAGMRGTLFMKGRVLDNWLLTASYDSEKDNEDVLFRDIQPDQFYPVYGDSSQRGFDAQSTSDVYVRMDRGRSYIQYGDFATSDGNSVLGLARYNRSMTGLKGHYETDSLSVNLFVADDSTRQVVHEIPGAGISGPYGADPSNPTDFDVPLFKDNYVRNSEQVELVVRRAGQQGIILDVQPLTRFTDYQIDEQNGLLLFRGPIQSVDSELNPIFIRVSYEVDEGGADYVTAGGSVEWRITESLAISGTYVKDNNPLGELTVQGAGVEFRPFENAAVMLEHAQTIRPVSGSEDVKGEANRAEVRFNEGRLSANLYFAQTDADYNTASTRTAIAPTQVTGSFNDNTGTLGAGRQEYGLDMTLRITDATSLRGNAYKTEDRLTAGTDEREHAELALSHRFGEYLTVEVNVAQTEGRIASGSVIDDQTYGARVSTKIPYIDNSTLALDYRRDTNDTDQSATSISLEAPVSQRTNVYMRHDIKNTLDSRQEGFSDDERHQTVFGFSTSYMDNAGSLFSEYRARDGFDGRSAQAAIGVRHGWELTDGLNLNASFEQVREIESSSANGSRPDSMSLALAADYTGDPLWKATGRLEWRKSGDRMSWLNTLGLGRKLSRDWTFLGRNSLTIDETKGNLIVRDRLQLGLAWRETDRNRWAVLGRYELEMLDDEQDNTDSMSHIFSVHANYKPAEAWNVSTRYAYKYTGETIAGGSENTFDTHLISGRLVYDFAERWDVGVTASTIFNDDANHHGLGLELGYLVAANLWVSAGYNLFGYSDDTQFNSDYTSDGAYIRFRYKFDETLFSGSDPYVNNLMPEAAGAFEEALQADRQN